MFKVYVLTINWHIQTYNLYLYSPTRSIIIQWSVILQYMHVYMYVMI